MAFQVYITDGINIAELDTDNIDVNGVFSISDIQNIAARKDTIKALKFVGTKTNNAAFGTFFDLGKTSDLNLSQNLFFNYNPIRSVTCLVYEDSNLIFKGSLRLAQLDIDKNGVVNYSTVLTGALIDLKTIIQDKYLTDLDFSDLTHHYNIINITNSWDTSTERYNVSTSAYTSTDFAYGSGYVYPNIDYGYFAKSGNTSNQVIGKNFKPAVYVKEYMDRIFTQNNLSGYTYEIKGSPEFKQMFNQLIIPDTQEGLYQTLSGFTVSGSISSTVTQLDGACFNYSQMVNGNTNNDEVYDNYTIIPTANFTLPPTDTVTDILTGYTTLTIVHNRIQSNIAIQRRNVDVLRFTRNITCNGDVSVRFLYIDNQEAIPVYYRVQLVKRTLEEETTANENWDFDGGWTVVGEEKILVQPNTYQSSTTFNINVGSTTFNEYDQLAIRVVTTATEQLYSFGVSGGTSGWFYKRGAIYAKFQVDDANVNVPSTTRDFIVTSIVPALTDGDIITPSAPRNIKLVDFLKSLMLVYNFYAYSKTENEKHIIFEKYDDFYYYCLPQNLIDNALNWSSKIDYNKNLTIKSNINLPKSYQFNFKEDEDYLSKSYKQKFNQGYGNFSFDDSYGLIDTKKVEVLFSPSITTQDTGTDRKYLALYQLESEIKKPVKTNIRLAYYNGMQDCKPLEIINESRDGLYNLETMWSGSTYPFCSNYYLSGTTAISDIHFGRPNEIYFPATDDYLNAETAYGYYINQVTDLTNQDVVYVNCEALLNPIDIANLDLKVPIYINTGDYNAAYFKILKLDYNGSDSTTKIELQKIAF